MSSFLSALLLLLLLLGPGDGRGVDEDRCFAAARGGQGTRSGGGESPDAVVE